MADNEARVFTLEEANDLLPGLSELIAALQEKRDAVAEIEVQIDAYELVAAGAKKKSDPQFERLMTEHQRVADEFHTIVDEIHSYGCFLKDVDLGLIDFYGTMNGRLVFWCWQSGEKQIGFWHEVDEGYPGRKPLEEL